MAWVSGEVGQGIQEYEILALRGAILLGSDWIALLRTPVSDKSRLTLMIVRWLVALFIY